MSFWRQLLNTVLPIAVYFAKKNNPDSKELIEIGGNILTGIKLPEIKDKIDFVISKEEQKIHDQLEADRANRDQENDVEAVGSTTNIISIVNYNERVLLESAIYSTLFTKYLTKESILSAPKNMVITNTNPRDIRASCGVNFSSGEFGFFPVIITKENCVMHGGHGSKGGMPYGIGTRNTGLSGSKCKDYGITFDDIKYYFLVRTSFEGRGQKVFGRSQIIEIKE